MTTMKKNYLNLIQNYINGWKQNNFEMIKNALADDCVIIESHGPKYNGIKEVACWFEFWINANSKIEKWNILSSYYCIEEETVFFEWDFLCHSNGNKYEILGSSIVKFSDKKISFIHEYRMTESTYKWDGSSLKSN
ncbi:MAG: nuclear transport factor 2 family protein [Bdellovibrionota bacterium]